MDIRLHNCLWVGQGRLEWPVGQTDRKCDRACSEVPAEKEEGAVTRPLFGSISIAGNPQLEFLQAGGG